MIHLKLNRVGETPKRVIFEGVPGQELHLPLDVARDLPEEIEVVVLEPGEALAEAEVAEVTEATFQHSDLIAAIERQTAELTAAIERSIEVQRALAGSGKIDVRYDGEPPTFPATPNGGW